MRTERECRCPGPPRTRGGPRSGNRAGLRSLSVDEVLRQAMEPVLRDLRGAGVAPARIEDDDWTGDPDSASAMVWSSDGSGTGVYVSRLAPAAERVAALADQVQQWAIEELQGGSATNWPPCPPHPDTHPMRAATRAGAALWECPADGTPIAPIGSLCCGDAAWGAHPGRR